MGLLSLLNRVLFPAPPLRWAIVEVLGHQRYVGPVVEAGLAGMKVLRVFALDEEGPRVVDVPPRSLHLLRYVSEQQARRAAAPPRAGVCEEWQSSRILPTVCRGCGQDEQAHKREAAKRAREERVERVAHVFAEVLDVNPWDLSIRWTGGGDVVGVDHNGRLVAEEQWARLSATGHSMVAWAESDNAASVERRDGYERCDCGSCIPC